MTKKEYLKALDTIRYIFNEGSLGHYDNVDKDGRCTEKELEQAKYILGVMQIDYITKFEMVNVNRINIVEEIDDAKNQLKKAYKKKG